MRHMNYEFRGSTDSDLLAGTATDDNMALERSSVITTRITMRKIFLHVGFPKCGSTSLQAALADAPNILFPKSGNHGGEHLALALTLRGLDDWTAQFFNADWVRQNQEQLMDEVRASESTVVLSSERLAAMKHSEIEDFKALFPNFDIHVIVVRREVTKYLSSTWRHAVYRHDYGETYETFLIGFREFSFGNVEDKFKQHFTVHDFDMTAPDYTSRLGALIGTTIEIPKANVGVPLEFAKLLQTTHALLGTREFQKRFDAKTKKEMLEVWSGRATVTIDPMTAPLF